MVQSLMCDRMTGPTSRLLAALVLLAVPWVGCLGDAQPGTSPRESPPAPGGGGSLGAGLAGDERAAVLAVTGPVQGLELTATFTDTDARDAGLYLRGEGSREPVFVAMEERFLYPLVQASRDGQGGHSRQAPVPLEEQAGWTFSYPQAGNLSANQTVRLVVGLAEGNEGGVNATWQGGPGRVELDELAGGLRTLVPGEFDEGTVVASQRGPTRVDASHAWTAERAWAAQARALMFEGSRYELCLTRASGTDCWTKTDWSGEPVGCPLTPLAGGERLDLEMESREGALFQIEALPLVGPEPGGDRVELSCRSSGGSPDGRGLGSPWSPAP